MPTFINQFFTFISAFITIPMLSIKKDNAFFSSQHQIKHFNNLDFSNIRNTKFSVWVINIIAAATTFIYKNALKIK